MLRLMSVAAAVWISVASICFAEDAPSDPNAPMIGFIKQQLVHKTFTRSMQLKIDNATVLSDTTISIRIVGVAESPQGFTFDQFTTITQTLQDLDTNGNPTGDKRRKDRINFIRYHLGARQSTGEVLGYSTTIAGSSKDGFPYSASAVRAKLEDQRLVLQEESVLYEDLFAPGGKFRPGAVSSTTSFTVKANGVEMSTKTIGYDVDPKTMARTMSDDLPVTIATEAKE